MSRNSRKRQARQLAKVVELNAKFARRRSFLTTKTSKSVFQPPIRRKLLKSIDSRHIVPSIDCFAVYPNRGVIVWANLSENDRQTLPSEIYNQTIRFGRNVIASTKKGP